MGEEESACVCVVGEGGSEIWIQEIGMAFTHTAHVKVAQQQREKIVYEAFHSRI